MISEKADTPSAVRPVGFWCLFCFMKRNVLCGQTTGPLPLGGNRNCCFGREYEPGRFPKSFSFKPPPHPQLWGVHLLALLFENLSNPILNLLILSALQPPASGELLPTTQNPYPCSRLIYLCNTPRKKNVVILLLQKGKIWGLFPKVPVNRCLMHEFALCEAFESQCFQMPELISIRDQSCVMSNVQTRITCRTV